MKLFYTVLLAIVVAALLPSPVLSWRIYALSNNLDVWQGGAWKTIPLVFGNVTGTFFVDQFIAPTQIGHDLTGDVFVTALNGVQGQRPFVTTDKVDYSTNTFIGSSFYIGRWAFDASNNFYSVNRYSPAPPPLNPIIKMPSASYNDNFGPFIGQATGTRDITSFRKGTAMVMVGAFTQVFNGNGTNPVDARNVALYNVGTGKWQALGAGIPYPPWRIVSDGTQLIALTNTSTLWRWNSTSKAWRSYQLTLTSSRGTPSIADLDFGGDKLFLVGNFDRVNGVGVRNVTMLSFGTAGALKVTGIGIGLPGGNRYCISARSASQVFVGGSTNGKKVVYEWRKGRAVPWDRIGSLGFSSGDAPVVAVTVVG